ncbi:acyltransferase 3 [Parvibaculum lavamentivorans DS-1]|uniref:Acyltransferase 3 n=1 Tax=Parvibaculum lavamentivorans (strain DS-1 / DSM 13023 / NCIMB 13966) TaxID=402881 RepID=A7HUE1_PARL1|nr:acyltransferase family protein [Parvibaculum lavamentivorans]ABS63524.1 acyltransferase 3 [Parvibaculum lavamentivorans DS-1]
MSFSAPATGSPGLKYRRDIDGLRCIAVLSVVLYHAGVPGITGGFVGVDIFFVISGYLITRILFDEVAEKRFSLLNFYDRRIRRILPAYAAAAIAASLAAWFILPPGEMENYGARLASTAAFVSNFYFRMETDYFAPAAGDNPLLHTWSLSVEEQFYLLWPLAMALLATSFFLPFRRALVWLALGGSFALACYAAVASPMAAFYYSPLRAWELLMGAVIALGFMPVFERRTNEGLAWAGLALAIAPCFIYVSGQTIFPGLTALFPCLGAALIIISGRHETTAAGRLLSWRPVVFIGLISYSLYLWHWPILVYTKIYLSRALTPVEIALALAVILAVSVASWHFIEKPFRGHSATTRTRSRIIGTALATLALLFAAGIATDIRDGWPGRASEATLIAEREHDVPARGPKGCVVDANKAVEPRGHGCLLGAGSEAEARMVLLGDSHAGSYAAAIDAAGKERGFGALQWTKSACTPLLEAEPLSTGILEGNSDGSCRAFMKNAVAKLAGMERIDTVFIAGFWSNATTDREAVAARAPAAPETYREFAEGLQSLVSALRGAGKRVVLLGQAPVYPNGGGDCVIRQRFLQKNDREICKVPRAYEEAMLSPAHAVLADIAAKDEGVLVYQGWEKFCEGAFCHATFDGHIVVRDEHHMSYLASRSHAPGIAVLIEGRRRGGRG